MSSTDRGLMSPARAPMAPGFVPRARGRGRVRAEVAGRRPLPRQPVDGGPQVVVAPLGRVLDGIADGRHEQIVVALAPGLEVLRHEPAAHHLERDAVGDGRILIGAQGLGVLLGLRLGVDGVVAHLEGARHGVGHDLAEPFGQAGHHRIGVRGLALRRLRERPRDGFSDLAHELGSLGVGHVVVSLDCVVVENRIDLGALDRPHGLVVSRNADDGPLLEFMGHRPGGAVSGDDRRRFRLGADGRGPQEPAVPCVLDARRERVAGQELEVGEQPAAFVPADIGGPAHGHRVRGAQEPLAVSEHHDRVALVGLEVHAAEVQRPSRRPRHP